MAAGVLEYALSRMPKILLSVALLALAAGCRRPAAPARLGVAVPLTGDLETAGRGIERAVRLAVEEANAQGDLPRPLELKVEDDRAEPMRAREVAAALGADPDVFAVVGHLTSGCSIEAARQYSTAGLAMITPSATAPEVTLQQTREDWSGPRVVFRLPPSDAVQGAFAADFAATRFGHKSVLIVRDGTPYGDGLAREFRRRFEERGGRIVDELTVARGQQDFSTLVDHARGLQFDLLFFGGVFAEAAPLLRHLRTGGLRRPFLSGDGSKNEDLFRLAGAAADGAFFTVGGVPVEHLPSAADFVEKYRARYGGANPRTFDHYGYVAARLAIAALRKTGSTERAKIVEALRRAEADTMVGHLSFDAKGDTQKSIISMTKAVYQEKRFELVY